MYRVLLDSSFRELAVGLAKDGHIIDKIEYEAWQRQSETMIPEIAKLLKKYDVKNEEIEAVVVSIGPGSYTGVRISLTIAKVMALALSCKLYTVSSLEILKDSRKPSICLINARSNRSYIGVYDQDSCLIKDTIWTNDKVLQFINDNKDFCLCGETEYLNLEGCKSDIIQRMLDISIKTKEQDNILSIKPVYLKD